jgi:hypothetical protein
MKKTASLVFFSAILSANLWSQQAKPQSDTLNQGKTDRIQPANRPEIREISNMEQVIIKAFQVGKNQDHPAFETVKAKDLQLRNLGQDIPMLLQHQTGIVSTSDAGNGIGYTGIRMRGSDEIGRAHV